MMIIRLWITKCVGNSTLGCRRWWHASWSWLERKPTDWIRPKLLKTVRLFSEQIRQKKIKDTGYPLADVWKRNYFIILLHIDYGEHEDHFAEQKWEKRKREKNWDSKIPGNHFIHFLSALLAEVHICQKNVRNQNTNQPMVMSRTNDKKKEKKFILTDVFNKILNRLRLMHT